MMLELLQAYIEQIESKYDLSPALAQITLKLQQETNVELASVFLLAKSRKSALLAASAGSPDLQQTRINISLKPELFTPLMSHDPLRLSIHQTTQILPGLTAQPDSALLATPILQHGELAGFFLLYQTQLDTFDADIEGLLITLGTQLGQALEYIRYEEGVVTRSTSRIEITGLGSVPGVGMGTIFTLHKVEHLKAISMQQSESIDEEISACKRALANTRRDISALMERMQGALPKNELALFEAYLKMLDHDNLELEICEKIQNEQLTAPCALKTVIQQHARQLKEAGDAYLSERADDFWDLGHRILWHLQDKAPTTPESYPERTIFVGNNLSASDLAQIPKSRLAAVVSASGSRTSHLALIARALNVPTIMGAKSIDLNALDGQPGIVDGYHGKLIVNPNQKLIKRYTELAAQEEQLQEKITQLRDLPTKSPDNYSLHLLVNMGVNLNTSSMLSSGAEGVGLFRTEMPFMQHQGFPTESQQLVLYRQILRSFSPKPVIMRLLDIGGDKILPYFPIYESNPFLGWRGLRVLLDHPDLLMTQVKAMIKANEGLGNLRILLPMVTNIAEVERACYLIQQVHQEIAGETRLPPIGVMVEIPAAAAQVGIISRRVDFISIGSNDLTQYLLAVDRNNSRVSELYNFFHPAVLSMISQIITTTHQQGKLVSLCGELAGVPEGVLLMMAFGIDALSMSAYHLLRSKWIIRTIPRSVAIEAWQQVSQYHDPQQIKDHLAGILDFHGLGGLVRAGIT